MKILLLSNLFTTKESLDGVFRSIFESVSIVQTSNLKNHSMIELINYDFIFMEIDEYSYKDIDIIWKLKSISTNLKIMLLDRNKCKETFETAVNNSIDGYISNLNDKDEFIYNVKKIQSGKKAYESDLIHNLVNKNDVYGMENLTRREKEVLDKISKGLNNRSIASSLYITEYTVKKHVSNIFSKLNLNNRQEAIIYMNQI